MIGVSCMGIFDKLRAPKSVPRWRTVKDRIAAMRYDELSKLAEDAKEKRSELDEMIFAVDDRLALPRLESNNFQAPRDADWIWRPEAWRGDVGTKGIAPAPSKVSLGSEINVFHDCPNSSLIVRQLRNERATDLSPFGVSVEVFQFDGSFLSLALQLPQEAMNGLSVRHIFQMDMVMDAENNMAVFARLNIKHGPNVEQLLNRIPTDQENVSLEFDLGYLKLNEKRLERVWLDLIFEDPAMNYINVRDLSVFRRPRGEF